MLKETTGGEFRVYRASIRYIDLLEGSYNGSYPPENVLDEGAARVFRASQLKRGCSLGPNNPINLRVQISLNSAPLASFNVQGLVSRVTRNTIAL